MTTDEALKRTARMRELGRELQQIALDLANEAQDALSKSVLRAALKAVSYVAPKPEAQGQ